MEKIFGGCDFYFMPKKQIRTQVHILKKKIEEHGGVFSDLQCKIITHIVHARRARHENDTVNNNDCPPPYHIRVTR